MKNELTDTDESALNFVFRSRPCLPDIDRHASAYSRLGSVRRGTVSRLFCGLASLPAADRGSLAYRGVRFGFCTSSMKQGF